MLQKSMRMWCRWGGILVLLAMAGPWFAPPVPAACQAQSDLNFTMPPFGDAAVPLLCSVLANNGTDFAAPTVCSFGDAQRIDLSPPKSQGLANPAGSSSNAGNKVMLQKPVRLYEAASGRAASVVTSFLFKLNAVNGTSWCCNNVTQFGLLEMSFQVAPSNLGPDPGIWDGTKTDFAAVIITLRDDIFNDGVAVPNLAVYMDSFDPESPSNLPTYLWSKDHFYNRTIATWIEYNATTQELVVAMLNVSSSSAGGDGSAAAAAERTKAVTVWARSGVNLSSNVQEYSYLGFAAYQYLNLGHINTSALSPDQLPSVSILDWSVSTIWSDKESQPPPRSSGWGAGPAAGPGLGPIPKKSSRWRLYLAVGLTVLAALGLSVAAFTLHRKYRSRPVSLSVTSDNDGPGEGSKPEVPAALSKLDVPRVFAYSELEAATCNFGTETVLGEGGFGKVHMGVLRDGTLLAIKRVAADSNQGMREFVAEVTIISRLRHKNLVPLKGWCHDRDELILVYEYMPNGSLDHHLYDQKHVLPWAMRFRIIQGVASGLVYLHGDWEGQTVVHRDIKASNILLDADWNARLGDFGLARLVEKHKLDKTVTATAGTPGYLDPHCLYSGKVGAESDVFSFGVLAIEVVSGRRPVEWEAEAEDRILVKWALGLHREGRLLDAVDGRLHLEGQFELDQALLVLRLGLLCCLDDLDKRPSMKLVFQYLSRDATLVTPRVE